MNSPPRANNASGDATSFKLLIVVYRNGTLSLIVNNGVSLPIVNKARTPKKIIPKNTPIINGLVTIFFKIDLTLTLLSPSLINIDKEIIANILNKGIEIAEITAASATGSLLP